MPDVPGATYTDKITVYMIGQLLDCGYHLYIDNWYNSMRLIKYLGACGTIRKNRVHEALRSEPVEIDDKQASGHCGLQQTHGWRGQTRSDKICLTK